VIDRLVQTSGRTQREIAGYLGIGLSTLVRWLGRSHSAIDFTSPAQFEKRSPNDPMSLY
jgi:transposase